MTPPIPQASRFLFTALVILTSAWLLHGFLLPVTWALILAIASWPAYRRLRDRLGQRLLLSATCMTFLVVVVLMLPLAWLAWKMTGELLYVSHFLMQAHQHGLAPPPALRQLPVVGSPLYSGWLRTLGHPHGLYDFLQPFAASQLELLRHIILGTGLQILHRAATFFLTVLVLFFLYKDGEVLAQQVNQLGASWFTARWPFYSQSVVKATRAVANGMVVIGLGEGLAIGLAYWLSGVAGPVLLTVITAILSMIPFGAPVGFGLAALVLVFQGKTLAALVVLAWGLVVTFVASHFLQPALIGGSLRLPFLAIFLSMFGGLATLGLSGLFVGPTVVILALDLWHRALLDTATSAAAISSSARQPETVGGHGKGPDQH